jgi:two-component system response regulator AtoC
MSFPLQAKLLQVVQDGEFSRLGGKADVQVDVRLIAATNRDLETAVAQGQFREDLYFRLNVVTINLPPLRDRPEEVPVLIDYFLKKYSVQYNRPHTSISSELHRQLGEYNWPGNVRQLENLIKRMVVLGTEAPILKELQQPAAPIPVRPLVPLTFPRAAQPQPVAAAPATPMSSRSRVAAAGIGEPALAGSAAMDIGSTGNVSLKEIARKAAQDAEKVLIARMLTRTCWNRKEAAEILGISYKALLYKIKENGLDRAS